VDRLDLNGILERLGRGYLDHANVGRNQRERLKVEGYSVTDVFGRFGWGLFSVADNDYFLAWGDYSRYSEIGLERQLPFS
jgi:hypothetical protein